jgi:hypothetical protein
VTDQTLTRLEVDRDTWIARAVASGIPAEYGVVLRQLTETVASGNGSSANDSVEKITGVAAGVFRDFPKNNADAWEAESK